MVNEYLDDVAQMQRQIRRKRRIGFVIVALLGLSPVLICLVPKAYYEIKDAMRERYTLSDAQRQQIESQSAAAQSAADQHDLRIALAVCERLLGRCHEDDLAGACVERKGRRGEGAQDVDHDDVAARFTRAFDSMRPDDFHEAAPV